MRTAIIFIMFLPIGIFSHAQKSHYDSISRILQQDSIEYEQQLKDANRIKQQTDSILKKELGYVEPITPGPDSATVLKNLRALAVQELQKQQEEENKKYYLFTGALFTLMIVVIIAYKSKQLKREGDKK